jgi:hypothetical protein
MPAHIAADLLAGFQRTTGRSSPIRASSPRRAHALPHRTTRDMLEALELMVTSQGAAEGALECIQSLELSHIHNAVTARADKLPLEVITGLEEAIAVPFLFFRWLSACFVEVRSAT